MKRKIFIVFIFILASHTFSPAQEVKNRFGIGLNGSGMKLIGGSSTLHEMDQSRGLSVFYGISNRWVASLQGDFSMVVPKNYLSGPLNEFLLYPFSVNFNFVPKPWNRIRYYLTAGAGLVSWDGRGNSPMSEWWPKFLLGAGIEGFISDRLSTAVYFNYNQVLKKPDAFVNGITDNRIIVEVGLSIKFWSSYKGDTDNDGIPNHLDRCSNELEDYDGFYDLDGCPEPDNDNDGVLDLDDYCRDVKEDRDGFEDLDGCPDQDNDQDLILDVNDNCKNIPEDFDGFQDQDGCPDIDNDMDNIADIIDKCPNQAEVLNGYLDDDGCPDEIATDIKKGIKVVLQNINFEYDSSVLLPESKPILDEVLRALTENDNIVLIIRGFTDEMGDFDYNIGLSRRRAEAVSSYLSEHGINKNRLKPVGYGETNPISDNSTEEGRLQNRRVEFVPVLEW